MLKKLEDALIRLDAKKNRMSDAQVEQVIGAMIWRYSSGNGIRQDLKNLQKAIDKITIGGKGVAMILRESLED